MQLDIRLLLAALLFQPAVAAPLYGGPPRGIELTKREDFDDSEAGALYGFLVGWAEDKMRL